MARSFLSKLLLPQATPSAVGEFATNAQGALLGFNGSTVDTYAPAGGANPTDIPFTQVGAAGSGSSFALGVGIANTGVGPPIFQKKSGVAYLVGSFASQYGALTSGSRVLTLPPAMCAQFVPAYRQGDPTLIQVTTLLYNKGDPPVPTIVPISFRLDYQGWLTYQDPYGNFNIPQYVNFFIAASWLTAS